MLSGVRGHPDGEGRRRDGRPRRRAASTAASRSASTSAPSAPRSTAVCRSASTRTLTDLLHTVEGYLAEGYRRIKLKIEPGHDVEPVRAVRERFGDILFQVDANAAYTLDDARQLAKLDEFDLLLIEQPLPEDDILGHAELARVVATPICLDESITSARGAEDAIALGACRIVNIKAGRVGGYLEARRVHDVCAANGRTGLVRRHARDRARPGRERRARRAPELHAARRHVGVRPLLRGGHLRAVRPARRAARRSGRARDSVSRRSRRSSSGSRRRSRSTAYAPSSRASSRAGGAAARARLARRRLPGRARRARRAAASGSGTCSGAPRSARPRRGTSPKQSR